MYEITEFDVIEYVSKPVEFSDVFELLILAQLSFALLYKRTSYKKSGFKPLIEHAFKASRVESYA